MYTDNIYLSTYHARTELYIYCVIRSVTKCLTVVVFEKYKKKKQKTITAYIPIPKRLITIVFSFRGTTQA